MLNSTSITHCEEIKLKKNYIDLPGENSALPLEDSYLDLGFDVYHKAAGDNIYVHGDHEKVANFGLSALISNFRLASRKGKMEKMLKLLV